MVPVNSSFSLALIRTSDGKLIASLFDIRQKSLLMESTVLLKTRNEVIEVKRNPFNEKEFAFVFFNQVQFFEVHADKLEIRKRKKMAIRFPKENIAEFNWFKLFKSKELLLINVFSKEEKENFTGRLIIYDRELRTEYAEFKEQTCFNIKQVDCPEIRA